MVIADNSVDLSTIVVTTEGCLKAQYADGAILTLSQHADTFAVTEHGGKRIQQLSRFAVHKYLPKLSIALEFRNLHLDEPAFHKRAARADAQQFAAGHAISLQQSSADAVPLPSEDPWWQEANCSLLPRRQVVHFQWTPEATYQYIQHTQEVEAWIHADDSCLRTEQHGKSLRHHRSGHEEPSTFAADVVPSHAWDADGRPCYPLAPIASHACMLREVCSALSRTKAHSQGGWADTKAEQPQDGLQELHEKRMREAMDLAGRIEALALGPAVGVAALNADVTKGMTGLRAKHRELELVAEELDSLKQQDQLRDELHACQRAYDELQRRLREANQKVRQGAERAALAERRALLAGADPLRGQLKLQSEDQAEDAAQDVTSSLQRTRQVLAQEIEHTGTALEAMATSHTTLGATTTQYGTQADSLKSSHGLLSTMRWHAILDWLVLWGGIAFFSLVVLYILQKRALYFVPSALKPSWGGFLGKGASELSPAAVDVGITDGGSVADSQPWAPQTEGEFNGAADSGFGDHADEPALQGAARDAATQTPATPASPARGAAASEHVRADYE
ncbi:hypothetical protein WJX73_002481 [Symbiochloris irregularis]|uniref:Uncharacterized protein n=1 Tax=Symbiochloris irregularis TaxID=706552 RepID=A0AAW1NWH2_9CHLO